MRTPDRRAVYLRETMTVPHYPAGTCAIITARFVLRLDAKHTLPCIRVRFGWSDENGRTTRSKWYRPGQHLETERAREARGKAK